MFQNLLNIAVLGCLILFWRKYRRSFSRPVDVLLFCWAGLAMFIYLDLWGLLTLRWPLGVAMGVVGWWIAGRYGRWRLDASVFWWLSLLGLMVLSSSWSLLPMYTLMRAGAMGLVISFAVIGVSMLCMQPKGLKVIFLCTMASALVLGPLIFGGMEMTGSSEGRYSGTQQLKSTGTATVALNFAIVMVFFACAGARQYRLMAWAGLLLALVVIAFSGTRGTMLIGLLILPAFWASVAMGRNGAAVIGSYLVVGVVGVMTWSMLPEEKADSILSFLRLDSVERATSTRIEGRWDVSLPKAFERPILGRGFGTSRYYLEDDVVVSSYPERRDQFEWAYTHNQYLSVFYEMGAVGLALFLVPIALIGMRVVEVFQAPGIRATNRLMFMAMSAMWLHQVLGMLFHDGRQTIGSASSYWFLIHSVWIWQAHRAFLSSPMRPGTRIGRRGLSSKRQWQKAEIS